MVVKRSIIERIAESIRLIPKISDREWAHGAEGPLRAYPDAENWHDHIELDANAWPKRVERRYSLVPTTCFNCESACGLLAYVDKESGQVSKFEGNPDHPGSRGRTCAKGPATINQIQDTERILPVQVNGNRLPGIRHLTRFPPRSVPPSRLARRTVWYTTWEGRAMRDTQIEC